jgi:hypothetical protein
LEKSGNQRFYGQNKLPLWHHALQPLGSFSHLAAYWKRSSKNTKNMNLQSILNKNSPWALMKLEFDGLDVARKLVIYIVHLPKNMI